MSAAVALEVRSREVERDGELDRRSFTVRVPAGLPCFEGHFDGQPVLPAVAQLHDVVLDLAREAWPELSRLRRVSRLKFRRTISPDSDLVVRIERRASAPSIAFTIECEGAVTSEGVLGFDEGA